MIKKKYIGVIILTCILLFMISSYPTTIHYYLQGKPFDLTQKIFETMIPYTLSRAHIWYDSFSYHSIFLLFVIPIVTAHFYLKPKIIGYDFLIIQRIGFKKHFEKTFSKLLLIAIIIACIPLLWYIILQILPLTNAVATPDNAVPSVTQMQLFSGDDVINIRENINIIYFYPLIRMIIVVILYAIFSYSIQLHFKNMALGIITPIILICVFDVTSDNLFPHNSFYFDLHSTSIIFPLPLVLCYATFILSISFTSMFIHYYLRKNNV